MQANKIADAISVLSKSMQEDPFHAWGWHCTMAVCFLDEGGSVEQANKAAARVMKLIFNIDVTKFDEWKRLPFVQDQSVCPASTPKN